MKLLSMHTIEKADSKDKPVPAATEIMSYHLARRSLQSAVDNHGGPRRERDRGKRAATVLSADPRPSPRQAGARR
ncbi:hypothetical protein E2C01_097495 [Portunus trituberculatus]|uniref:Uncharacterized protein n=1 Tax=Portunus trituberculatus TaxID=210409 RepID=A0A5B7K5V4_PORTR|nr:hypothetical protein [Portunus trituberculatus]